MFALVYFIWMVSRRKEPGFEFTTILIERERERAKVEGIFSVWGGCREANRLFCMHVMWQCVEEYWALLDLTVLQIEAIFN